MRSSWGSSSSTAAARVKWDNASVHHEILHLPSRPWPKIVFKVVFNELPSLSPVQSRNIIYSVYGAGHELWSRCQQWVIGGLGHTWDVPAGINRWEQDPETCVAQQQLFWALHARWCRKLGFGGAKGWWENGILLQSFASSNLHRSLWRNMVLINAQNCPLSLVSSFHTM